MKQLKIGTRGSTLALAQTALVVGALKQIQPNINVEVVKLLTSGDKKQDNPTNSKRDKRDWILELEVAIERGEIDCAVHSAKDAPADISEKTELIAVLDREDARDVFIGRMRQSTGKRLNFWELPGGATVASSSLRRQAQIKILRPDLSVCDLRGNVPTRIRKLDSNESLSGTVLAAAGLKRLGFEVAQTDVFELSAMLPAVNQGIIALQFLGQRQELAQLFSHIQVPKVQSAFLAERTCVKLLQADCDSSLAVHAITLSANSLNLSAKVFMPDGSMKIESHLSGTPDAAIELGEKLARDLLAKGAADILRHSRKRA